MFGRRSSGLPGSITCAQLSLRFASRITSLSPLIHTSAFLARTGSAPSETWPVVVMSFALREQQRDARLLAGARRDRERHVRAVEIGRRLEAPGVVLVDSSRVPFE